MDTELYKNRSLVRCMSDAFDLFRTNFRTLFRRLWFAALVLSVITAMTWSASMCLQQYENGQYMPMGFLLMSVLLVLSFAANVWCFTIVMSLAMGKSIKVSLPRIVQVSFALLLLSVFLIVLFFTVMAYLPIGLKNNVFLYLGITFALLSVLFAVILPLCYSVMKYCVEDGLKVISVFRRPYITGWRNWGFLFIVVLLTGIIINVAMAIIYVPVSVLEFSFEANLRSMWMDDVSGLPTMFYLLTFVTATICTFVATFVMPWPVLVLYYVYGCVEVRENTKRTIKESRQNEVAIVNFEDVK